MWTRPPVNTKQESYKIAGNHSKAKISQILVAMLQNNIYKITASEIVYCGTAKK